jgi:hypothetical protein
MAVMERAIEAPAGVGHGDVVVSDGVRIHYMEAGAGVPVAPPRYNDEIASFVRANDPK